MARTEFQLEIYADRREFRRGKADGNCYKRCIVNSLVIIAGEGDTCESWSLV